MEFTPSVTIELKEYKRLERVESRYDEVIAIMRSSIKREMGEEGYEIEINKEIILNLLKVKCFNEIDKSLIKKIEFEK
jgi:hypothetical protein